MKKRQVIKALEVNNMKYTTDYEILHVHELEAALKNIDETESPEEAAYIRKLISEGGYKKPDGTNYKSSEFSNVYFKWSLILLLSFFLLLNLLVFVTTLYPYSLIPVAFQALLITLIFRKSPHVRALVKLWAALMVIGSIAHLWSIYLSVGAINMAGIIERSILLVIGLSIFWFAGKLIVLNEETSNK